MTMVKNGNIESLAPLYEKYKIPLYNFFYRLTFNGDISNDLTQTVFYRMIKYRHSFKRENKFRSWMYQMARNVNIDHYKKNRLWIDKYQNPEQISEKDQTNDEEMENKEKHTKLYEALGKLSREQREIIELSRFQCLKFEEIAEITGSSAGALRTRAHRAISRLREIYFEND